MSFPFLPQAVSLIVGPHAQIADDAVRLLADVAGEPLDPVYRLDPVQIPLGQARHPAPQDRFLFLKVVCIQKLQKQPAVSGRRYQG